MAALADHRAALEPDFLDLAAGRLRIAVQSFVLHLGDRTILIDSCIGDDRDRPEVPVWNQRHNTGFLERMRRAGTDPAAVDTVLWRYLFGRAELADWMALREAGTSRPCTVPRSRTASSRSWMPASPISSTAAMSWAQA